MENHIIGRSDRTLTINTPYGTSVQRGRTLTNGMLGTVLDVGSDQIRVEFDTDENGQQRRLTFAPQQFPAIDHGFAVSIHRSQGCTVDRSFVLSSKTLDKHLTYVAMTRHKDAARFYNAPDIEPRQQLMRQNQETYRNFTARSPSRSR